MKADLIDCFSKAISEGHGDTAMVLLKAGAEADKRDGDGNLAIDLAPDRKVRLRSDQLHLNVTKDRC